MANTRKTKARPRSGDELLTLVLNDTNPRPAPSSSQGEKTNYAVRFADKMAEELAKDLQNLFPGIDASTKRTAHSSKGKKQLDINFSTPKLGLALGVSLKSVHIREAGGAGRYTHNLKRNDEELGTEAAVYHERQPYAVMVAIMFLPFDSCTDGKKGPSSFGSWVKSLRPRVGRSAPDDQISLFEKGYIALYSPDGSDLKFFDIQSAPPKQGIPQNGLLTYEEFVLEVYGAYQARNHSEFRWADGDVEMLTPDDDGE